MSLLQKAKARQRDLKISGTLYLSDRQGKKLMLIHDNKKIHFGDSSSTTFLEGASIEKRRRTFCGNAGARHEDSPTKGRARDDWLRPLIDLLLHGFKHFSKIYQAWPQVHWLGRREYLELDSGASKREGLRPLFIIRQLINCQSTLPTSPLSKKASKPNKLRRHHSKMLDKLLH